jgi:hypothetical protein
VTRRRMEADWNFVWDWHARLKKKPPLAP